MRWTAPSLAGGALVVTGTDLKLTAVNLADGTVRWRHDAASYNAAPAVVGSGVVVASRDKRVQLLALDALDRLYEYEGAKREILAAARADLDAEEARRRRLSLRPEPEPEAADAAASDRGRRSLRHRRRLWRRKRPPARSSLRHRRRRGCSRRHRRGT